MAIFLSIRLKRELAGIFLLLTVSVFQPSTVLGGIEPRRQSRED
jgi:hypothetical protein